MKVDSIGDALLLIGMVLIFMTIIFRYIYSFVRKYYVSTSERQVLIFLLDNENEGNGNEYRRKLVESTHSIHAVDLLLERNFAYDYNGKLRLTATGRRLATVFKKRGKDV